MLLLDEPGAFLDVAARVGLLALLRELARTEKMVVVASTHFLELALRIADRVWLVDRNGELRTGTPEELAAAGAVGAVFDTPDLAFEPASGTFAGTGSPGPTVRVRGEQAALIGRALRREGWTPVPDGPANAEVTGRLGGCFRAQTAGTTADVDGWAALEEWARGTAPGPPQRAGDDDVLAAIRAATSVGAYFAVETGPADGPGWIPLDADGLAGLTDTVGERLGTDERRVAASIMFQGLAARLVSPVLAGLGRGIVLDLDPAVTAVQTRIGEAMGVTCPQPGGWLAPDPDVALVADVLLEQRLRPLVDAAAADGPVAPGLLWGNVASALVGALGVLGAGEGSVAARVVRELLDHGPLAGSGELGPGGFRRRSCCLFYRTPAGGYCGDCALVPAR